MKFTIPLLILFSSATGTPVDSLGHPKSIVEARVYTPCYWLFPDPVCCATDVHGVLDVDCDRRECTS